jgi:dihydroorotase
MVHIGMTPPHVAEVLPHLRPGDILTHCYTGAGPHMLDADGALLEVAHRAWNSGIILDCGHGAGSFSFEVAERLMSAGLRPDVISSDIHQISIHGPMFDLPTVMSKFMALGMSFAEVIRATTARPAEVLGLQREVGTLRPGALADVALFRLHQGRFPFYDVHMQRREGSALIRNTLTIVNGVPLVPTTTERPAPWIDLTPDQRALHERQHTPAHLSAGVT